jgi:hypothetical protein
MENIPSKKFGVRIANSMRNIGIDHLSKEEIRLLIEGGAFKIGNHSFFNGIRLKNFGRKSFEEIKKFVNA